MCEKHIALDHLKLDTFEFLQVTEDLEVMTLLSLRYLQIRPILDHRSPFPGTSSQLLDELACATALRHLGRCGSIVGLGFHHCQLYRSPSFLEARLWDTLVYLDEKH